MNRKVLLGVGVVVLILGLVFLLQGAGLFKGSAMTDNHFWVYAGAFIALAGAAMVAVGLRPRR